MTSNQIEYAKYLANKRQQTKTLKETQRHNKASEGEVLRHNQVTELQTNQSITEANRHNLASEALTDKSITVGAETSKYVADTSAAATKYAASTNAAATMYAASTSAEASKYASDTQYAIADLNGQIKRITTYYNNEKQGERTEATNLANQAMNAATNATKLSINATNAQIQQTRNNIEKAKANAQQAYNEGRLKIDTFNAIVNACDTALDYLKYLHPKKGVR